MYKLNCSFKYVDQGERALYNMHWTSFHFKIIFFMKIIILILKCIAKHNTLRIEPAPNNLYSNNYFKRSIKIDFHTILSHIAN